MLRKLTPSRCLGAVALLVAMLAGCASAPAAGPKAMVQLKPASGSQASGEAWLEQEGERVVVQMRMSGLAPNREHGLHVHEKGDCSSPDASSAGGHFNPTKTRHGAQGGEHHAGDLPSLKADASGNATTTFEVKGVLLGSGASDIMGKAMVVHADPDDYMSQPAGNAGKRIACGVIVTPATPGGIGGSSNAQTIPKQM